MITDKRFQVFVSSTYVDLVEERQAVISSLLQLRAFPAGMELFPAANDDAWTLIQRVIAECDYYLLVIGGRYGSTDPASDISYTEKEYDYAVSLGKPVMAFLHGDPDAIPVGKSERSPEAVEKLAAFRRKVKDAKHVKFWNSAEHLAGQVALSFAIFTQQYPAVGWIRADEQASPEALSELNELRKKLAELEDQLERNRTMPPPGTERLSQGDDTVEVPVHVSVGWKPNDRYAIVEEVQLSDWDAIRSTWDAVFGALSSKLLGECAEKQLRNYLNRWVLTEFWKEAEYIGKLRAEVEDSGRNFEAGHPTNPSMEIREADFGTVLLQLDALGLITRSEKRRSINDTQTYWTLTPYGRHRAIQIRAVTRDAQ